MPFAIGHMVAVRADRARVGPVVGLLAPIDGLQRYRVFHAPGRNSQDLWIRVSRDLLITS